MAQISIRNNLLKRYNNKFRRNEKGVCATESSVVSVVQVVVAMQACDNPSS
jgi:hypothetical protein